MKSILSIATLVVAFLLSVPSVRAQSYSFGGSPPGQTSFFNQATNVSTSNGQDTDDQWSFADDALCAGAVFGLLDWATDDFHHHSSNSWGGTSTTPAPEGSTLFTLAILLTCLVVLCISCAPRNSRGYRGQGEPPVGPVSTSPPETKIQ